MSLLRALQISVRIRTSLCKGCRALYWEWKSVSQSSGLLCTITVCSGNAWRNESRCPHVTAALVSVCTPAQHLLRSLHLQHGEVCSSVAPRKHTSLSVRLSCSYKGNYCRIGNFFNVVRDSSVGIATCYGLGGPVIESWCGRDFRYPSRSALVPRHRVFRGVKAAGAWRWPPTPN